MLEFLYGWVRNIIMFIVLTTIITNLLGKSSYKKYVNLITGLILLLIVINPLIELLRIDDKLDYFFSTNNLLAATKEKELIFEEIDIGKSASILQEYKDKIAEQVSTILEKENLYPSYTNIVVDEDSSSLTYGEIKSIHIIASYVRNNKIEDEIGLNKISIDRIHIGNLYDDDNKIKMEGKDSLGQENKDKIPTPDEINAKKRLSDFYNLKTDNINISIQD